ncbi:hypothetical protein [Paenibacillus puerhi]|uniref:hypothetical protein n=1 Tax=Paenibacillus puerhi TaxID=2692622 RepID=UPI00135BD8C3|nr:hypothetical protein [Paenibacillus puerhi]
MRGTEGKPSAGIRNFTCDILEINRYPGIVIKVVDYIFADKLLHFNRIGHVEG